MTRPCRLFGAVFVLLAALLWCGGGEPRAACADPAPQEIDALLEWQDHLVLSTYQQQFSQDKRYNAVLGRIGSRLNPHLGEVYANPQFKIYYYVFFSRMGFNAQTWTHVIIFDSLLVDALRHLADGVAVYGNTNNDYVHALAERVARASMADEAGVYEPDLQRPDNPFLLPVVSGMTVEQQQHAEALFESMLAGWMAHEGSHAFLQHNRERVQAEQLRQLYRQGYVAPAEVRARINQALSYSNGKAREREADERGTRLIVRAGYGADGLIYSLEFAQLIEELCGTNNMYFRTHPTPRERIATVRAVEAAERKAAPAGSGQAPH